MFDAVCCVNLTRRPDRWADFLARLPADWPYKKPSRFPATDGQRCPPPAWWGESAGAWGCYRSHLRIVEECLNSGFESVLIFEDDALLTDGFVADAQAFLSELPADWQWAYLGGQLLRDGFRPPVKVTDWVYRPYNVNRTHAYAVRGTPMLRAIYAHLQNGDWFPRHHIDHHYGRLHQTGRYGVYVPRRWLVGQLGGASDVSTDATETTYWNHAAEVAARGPERFVAVLGLHASAAANVAVALHHLGVFMGGDFAGAADPHDAEDRALALLCEAFAPFPTVGVATRADVVRDRLEEWLGNHQWLARCAGALAGAKYPHLCVFGPQLHAMCGDRLRVIDVLEPLDMAVEALRARLRTVPDASPDNVARAADVQAWLFQEKERFLSTVPHLSLGGAYLRGQPAAAVRAIAEYLNLSPTLEQLDRAIAALSAA